MVEWHYSERKGHQAGPVTQSELARMAADLPLGTLVWRPGLDEWEPIEQHFGDAAPGPWSDGAPAPVDVTEAVVDGWRRWAQLRGRSNRAHYWFWALFCLVISGLLGGLDSAMGASDTGPFGGLFALVTLVPSVTVAARRLHDTDRSGWWLLLWFVPLVGWIILLVWMVQKGTLGANRFGRQV